MRSRGLPQRRRGSLDPLLGCLSPGPPKANKQTSGRRLTPGLRSDLIRQTVKRIENSTWLKLPARQSRCGLDFRFRSPRQPHESEKREFVTADSSGLARAARRSSRSVRAPRKGMFCSRSRDSAEKTIPFSVIVDSRKMPVFGRVLSASDWKEGNASDVPNIILHNPSWSHHHE